jgi:hypothetical protein
MENSVTHQKTILKVKKPIGSKSDLGIFILVKKIEFHPVPLNSIVYSVLASVADPDPGSGAFLTPGSGIRNRFFQDPGSQTHIFESLVKTFWVKTSIIL